MLSGRKSKVRDLSGRRLRKSFSMSVFLFGRRFLAVFGGMPAAIVFVFLCNMAESFISRRFLENSPAIYGWALRPNKPYKSRQGREGFRP
jgi:hypothetical protein